MIYADYNATTPVDSRVVEAMTSALSNNFGNPASSLHSVGAMAKEAVEQSRTVIAFTLGVRPHEVVFTSGATESLNLAIHGVLSREVQDPRSRRRRVLIASTEHKAVIESASYWCGQFGFTLQELHVDSSGLVPIQTLASQMDVDVALVAIALANNETGVINPIRELSETVHSFGSLFLTDATQALGKIPLDIGELDVDLAAISAHKAYGPKGVGALIGTRKILNHLPSYQSGGGQEKGIRGGTLNVPGIVGFACAAEIATTDLKQWTREIAELKTYLISEVTCRVHDVHINGQSAPTLANTINFRFVGADSEAVINATRGIAISTGSACQSSVPAPSHVLTAMGLQHHEARECLRISLGRYSTKSEVDEIVTQLVQAVSHVRSVS